MPRAIETTEERIMRYFKEADLGVAEMMLRLITGEVRSKRPTVTRAPQKKRIQTRGHGGQGGAVARAIAENVAKPEGGASEQAGPATATS